MGQGALVDDLHNVPFFGVEPDGSGVFAVDFQGEMVSEVARGKCGFIGPRRLGDGFGISWQIWLQTPRTKPGWTGRIHIHQRKVSGCGARRQGNCAIDPSGMDRTGIVSPPQMHKRKCRLWILLHVDKMNAPDASDDTRSKGAPVPPPDQPGRRLLRKCVLFGSLLGPIAVAIAGLSGSPALALELLPASVIPHLLYLLGTFVPKLGLFYSGVTRFSPTENEIWLTLDDGPDPEFTPQVLSLLAEYKARATFFLIGEKANAHPDLVASIVKAGHSLGNHTLQHRSASFWALPSLVVEREVDGCSHVLNEICGSAPRLFRPPVGMVTPFLGEVLGQRDLHLVLWNARGFDTTGRSPEKIARRILRDCRPGAIILAHPERGWVQLRALELMLRELSVGGLRCVIPSEDRMIPGRRRGTPRGCGQAASAPCDHAP